MSRSVSMGCQKPGVPVGHQLAVRAQPLQRRLLEDGLVAFDVVDHFRRQHQKAAIDPGAVALRLFAKAGNLICGIDIECAETTWRLNRGDGREQPVLAYGIPPMRRYRCPRRRRRR